MNVDVLYIVVIFAIGFVGSFFSGMLGIGGTIIKYPMLLYIPPLFGIIPFTAHEVSGISAVEVLFSSLAGMLMARKSGHLHIPLILWMGIPVLLGSLMSSMSSGYFSESGVNIVYGSLALIAAIMLFIPREETPLKPVAEVTFPKPLAAMLAFSVGMCSGIVGAAGGFLLVPIMLMVLRIPTRIVIASSLAIAFLSSIGSSIGKVTTGQVDYWPALIMIVASVIAAPLGVKVSTKMNVKVLQYMLAFMIAATAVKIWVDILL